ncbi:MAG TPA: 4-hydroxy-3-methylbut-2-enyl diphosphate reductase [Candidatus Hydrogenedentes bacterium]|nr:4-hydroxy-3-methylbut-2-enyl diphosphate reductase [Candidatus Hydrogenedentota bacterium]HOL77993.1 4-hydroxy-3-methylbut-2-enyl diphosphate reductase [Candidatus Hydrogenedentota bacterium]HPO87087.1 4-hydroxy-3-methylbut-2-enyl diphosphate reductase [Candidatus Hydrogenedentota bacterium]
MRIILARPRGFCAGVERAIRCVEEALNRFGAPVYVLHDIVHNAHVVEELRRKGAVFVGDVSEVPEGAHLLFSAHGVGPDLYEIAKQRNMHVIDATCPLVEKVHNEARRFASKGFTIILIGEEGHDETVGTMGWAPDHIRRVFTLDDVEALTVEDPEKVAYITQTTLSVEECARVIEALKKKFPKIQAPPKADICYATSNRQAAVNMLAPMADLVLVVGDRASANSNRLAEICRANGKPAYLISDASAIQPEWLEGVNSIVLTAGASAPEALVQGVVAYFRSRGPVEVEEHTLIPENVHFNLPREINLFS